MPSLFPCSPMVREWLRKKTQVEKKKKKIAYLQRNIYLDEKLSKLQIQNKLRNYDIHAPDITMI